MGEIFWAHSDPTGRTPTDPEALWQPLRDHLVRVGNLAHDFGQQCCSDPTFARRAQAAGLLHDLGKYLEAFQKLLRGEVNSAPHSIYGAAAAVALSQAVDVGFVVAGHHAGIPNRSTLKDRIAEAKRELDTLWGRATVDCPELIACVPQEDSLLGNLTAASPLEFDVHCRMLLSCLVDADRLDTAEHAGEPRPPSEPLNAGARLNRLLQKIDARAKQQEDGAVKRARATVLADCLAAAQQPGQRFSLTVPTGGGKTLSSMAFALRRAELLPSIRRVIVVIPYLSIIEQNAGVYRDALDINILEHHSGALGSNTEEDDGYTNPTHRTATENWDAPIVVTTSVRFFETLFSNHPRDLRRLHNIANAVVILDEVQTLPREYLQSTLSLIKELAEHWGVTFVFSTATQPAFEKPDMTDRQDPRWPPGTLTEITQNVTALFGHLQRVTTYWRERPLGWEQIGQELAEESQALVIVNTRKHARALAEECVRTNPSAIHLSTNLCPAHRRKLLAEIRADLQAGRKCLVISTQLVEAGVDLDFPLVWRALGPLDSIAQAAGRCDREGRLTERLGTPGGRLVVFKPVVEGMPPGSYKHGASITQAMASSGAVQWDQPASIRDYFHRLRHVSESQLLSH